MRLAHSACRRATPTPTPTYSRPYLQQLHHQQQRPFSASTTRHNPPTPNPQTQTTKATKAAATTTPLPPPPPARWITDLRARIGKCLVFGCDRQQISQAAGVLRAIATEWRELLAGSEGYLTGGRRGLDAREVVWGEMDSFVSFFFLSGVWFVPGLAVWTVWDGGKWMGGWVRWVTD
jgi:hypothetical protein